VIAALRAANKLGKVKLVLLSARKASITALRRGQAQLVVAEALGNIGAGALQAAYDDANGKTLPKKIIIPLCVITKSTINKPINAPCLQEG
jgi:ABC-type sugar transport system substrate-binding protein